MDNCLIPDDQDVGVVFHFFPPYSPDFMLIELAFSKVKTTLAEDIGLGHMKDITDLETIHLRP